MTARERRTVRLGVIAAGLIILYVVAIDPYLSARAEARARIESAEAQLMRQQSLARSLPAYRQRLAAAQATWNQEVRPRLLAGDLPAVSASDLSAEVRRIAAQSFLEVERENVLASSDQDGLTSIPVQFSLRGDIYGLRDFLAALETSRTFLNLRELRVNSVGAGYNQGMTIALAPLQITVTVEGYLGGEPAPAEASAGEAGTGAPLDTVGAGNAGAGAGAEAGPVQGGGAGASGQVGAGAGAPGGQTPGGRAGLQPAPGGAVGGPVNPGGGIGGAAPGQAPGGGAPTTAPAPGAPPSGGVAPNNNPAGAQAPAAPNVTVITPTPTAPARGAPTLAPDQPLRQPPPGGGGGGGGGQP
jgi:Tfp pilus assembly protein PilO